jgi:hypothetical protein
MGLDIYLYTKAQQLQNEAHSKEETDFYGEEWELYDEKTEEEKEEFRNNRQYSYCCNTDVPSRNYPDEPTLNNRRYLRSSYNGGGFDSAVPKYLGRQATYEWIFGEAIKIREQEYDKWWTEEDIPALKNAAERAYQIADDLRELKTPLSVLTVSGNMFSAPSQLTDTDALSWAKGEAEKENDEMLKFFGGGGWQNATGHYFTLASPLKVVGAVPGVDIFGHPAVHLVYQPEEEARESYIQSAVIAGEFAEEAIELIREDGSCYVSWSG